MNLICWLFGHNFQVPAQIHAGGMFIYEANTGLEPKSMELLPCEVVVINSGTRIPSVVNPRPVNWVWCKRCAKQETLKIVMPPKSMPGFELKSVRGVCASEPLTRETAHPPILGAV